MCVCLRPCYPILSQEHSIWLCCIFENVLVVLFNYLFVLNFFRKDKTQTEKQNCFIGWMNSLKHVGMRQSDMPSNGAYLLMQCMYWH